MQNLYEMLGVQKKASVEKIRNAYRQLAKRMHPDKKGGSIERFTSLKKAHDILIDPERRKKYDATGDVSEKSPDNEFSIAMGIIAASLEQIFLAIEQHNCDPSEFDMIADLVRVLNNWQTETNKALQKINNALSSSEKAQGRFVIGSGNNYIESIIEARITQLRQKKETEESRKKGIESALKLLKAYKYKSKRGYILSVFDLRSNQQTVHTW